MEVASTATDVPLPRPFTPIIFAGPGANLYPLCDPYSSSPSESLPKALLPVANRPLISYTLQHLVSAGLKHALLLAPANQHKSIEAALRSIRLHGPPQAPAKGTQASSSSAASSNIAVIDGLAATSSSSSMSSSGSSNVVISVELLPLGPFDGKTTTADDDDESSNGRASEFRKTSRPGTAELLRWIDYIGKLEVSLIAIGHNVEPTTSEHSLIYLLVPPTMAFFSLTLSFCHWTFWRQACRFQPSCCHATLLATQTSHLSWLCSMSGVRVNQ